MRGANATKHHRGPRRTRIRAWVRTQVLALARARAWVEALARARGQPWARAPTRARLRARGAYAWTCACARARRRNWTRRGAGEPSNGPTALGCPGFFEPGIRSLVPVKFPYAVPLLGSENGPDFGTAFLTDLVPIPRWRPRIWKLHSGYWR